MANKADKLIEKVNDWKHEADVAHQRPGTTPTEDAQHARTLKKCADDVERIVNDHTQD